MEKESLDCTILEEKGKTGRRTCYCSTHTCPEF
jgi:hypothetical protein